MSETLDVDALIEEKFNQIANNAYLPQGTKIDSQTFTLFPNYVETKVGNIKKSISLMDFKSIIDGLLNTETKLSQFALPYNCYTFAKSATEIQLACYHPERIAEISHISRDTGKSKKYKIPFPNTVIGYRLQLRDGVWAIADVKYYCTNKKVTQLPEDRLIDAPDNRGIWLMPFPNYYGDGRMCYGRNAMPNRYASILS